MDNEKYEKLKKDVKYLNEEGFIPEGQQLHVYRNADELINAIRNNQVPGITWTEEDEAKWQAAEAIDKVFEESDAFDEGTFFLDEDCEIDRLEDQGAIELVESWTIDENGVWHTNHAIDQAFNEEEVNTVCDEFNDGNLDAPEIKRGTVEEFFNDTVVEWTEEEWEIWNRDWGDLDDDTIIQ